MKFLNTENEIGQRHIVGAFGKQRKEGASGWKLTSFECLFQTRHLPSVPMISSYGF